MSLWKTLHAVYTGTITTAPVRMDSVTDVLSTIDYEHHELHSGSSFTVHVDNTTANSDDDRTLIGFECPNTTKWAHLIVSVSAANAAEAFLYEGVTIDDGEGTELTIEDRNRNTNNTSTMLSFENPAVAGLATWMTEAELANANFSATTTLDHFQLVAGQGPKALGGERRGAQEWILKQGLKYAIIIQNIGASANLHEIHLDWYEHTNRHP